MPKISKVYLMPDEEFIALVATADSYSDILRKLNLTTRGGSSLAILKRRITELNCSTKHFGQKAAINAPNIKYALDDILVENSTYMNIARLKIRLVKEKRLEYKCALCGISEWQGHPLSLQLDHINGKHNDHRIENLRFLCPNCHSQTETYAGKNKGESFNGEDPGLQNQ